MPELTVAEQMLYSTVKLTASRGGVPVSTGTGFFMEFALRGDQMVPAIVTNKHVARLQRFATLGMETSLQASSLLAHLQLLRAS